MIRLQWSIFLLIFFFVAMHTEYLPRTPVKVMPTNFIALIAYSGSAHQIQCQSTPPTIWINEQSKYRFIYLHNWFKYWFHTHRVPNNVHDGLKGFFFFFFFLPVYWTLTIKVWGGLLRRFKVLYIYCNGHWMKNYPNIISNTRKFDSMLDSTCAYVVYMIWCHYSNYSLHLL